MKIAIFSNSSWSIYNFRRNLIKKLIDLKHRIIIISSKDAFTSKLTKMGCEFVNIDLKNNKIYLLSEIFLLVKIIYIFFKIKPDCLLNYTIKPLIYGTFLANFFSIKVINMITGLGTIFIKNNYLTKIVIFFYRISFKKVKVVFFQNKDDLKIFIDNQIIPKKKAILIPGSGVDLKFYKFFRLKKKKKLRFILISRMLIEKGIVEYLEAASKFSKKNNCEFYLLGPIIENNSSSISKELIHKFVKQKTIKYITFVKNINKHIKNADCVVLPSYREGTPRSLLEACSIGRPIITTNAPGCKNVIRNNFNGFKCFPRSANSLFIAMKKFLNLTHKQRKQMSLNARKFVKLNFDEKLVIKKYLNEIKTLNV